jgi:hypothetical protein
MCRRTEQDDTLKRETVQVTGNEAVEGLTARPSTVWSTTPARAFQERSLTAEGI